MEFGISLGVGGLDIGLLVEPGPGVALPGAHGPVDELPATVLEVPAGCDGVLPATVELLGLDVELVLVEGVVLVVPLLVGVHGATVVVVLDWLLVPSVPPVTLPALPAVPGVLCVAAGVPVELAPGAVVVVVGLCVVVVPGVVVPGIVVVAPGWVFVVPGAGVVVVGVVC